MINVSLIRKKTLLFLSILGIFFNTFSVGNEFPIYGYFFFVTGSLILFFFQGSVYKSQFIYFIFLSFVFLLYLPINPALGFSQISFFLLLLPMFIIPWLFSANDLSSSIIVASFWLLILFNFLFFLGVGVNYSYGAPRMQGLMSEPSAIALPSTIIILMGLLSNRKHYTFVGFLSVVMSGSLISIITPFLAILLYFVISRASNFLRFTATCFLFFAFLGFLQFIIWLPFEQSLISRLQSGILSILSWGQSGYNPRLDYVLGLISYLLDSESFIFGFGLNSASIINIEDHGFRRTFSLPFEILFSFGVLGFLVFVAANLLVIYISKENLKVNVAFASLFSYCWVNSAMGITLQILYISILIMMVKNLFSRSCPRILRAK